MNNQTQSMNGKNALLFIKEEEFFANRERNKDNLAQWEIEKRKILELQKKLDQEREEKTISLR